ncbi:MAG: hypothetical protein PHC30_01305 [Lentisphaeria bacterium]|nr:hypothetical protein [Lentisphaeria bacterium]
MKDTSGIKALGQSRELLWDLDRLAELGGRAALTLHRPEFRPVALVHDQPWEGSTCGYHTVFRDQAGYKMYYRGSDYRNGKSTHPEVTCLAESGDGVTWQRPKLGLYEFNGSRDNNIILMDDCATHNFSPFADTRPGCPPEQAYKALGGRNAKTGLFAFASADGAHWTRMADQPVITKGAFDSQNIAFWDGRRGLYVSFFRDFQILADGRRCRAIKTSTSPDFLNWSEPVWLKYEDGTPDEELYTNAVLPYPRAPEVYVGFPKRFQAGRVSCYDHSGAGGLPGLSDGVFMSSRDGVLFKRWTEAFVRPGLQPERWVNRNNMTAWGLVQTAPELPGTPPELSLYSTENYYSEGAVRLRRLTVRLDGFVSVQAPLAGGSLLTRPFTFGAPAGAQPVCLRLNASTSAAGGIRAELRSVENGRPLPGFAAEDGDVLYGDGIDLAMQWKGGDLRPWSGHPVQLRLELHDADVFSYQFA